MRILLLTSVWKYKSSRNTVTSVINDYAYGYEALGHQVCIVHSRVKVPFMFLYRVKFIRRWLENRFALVVDDKKQDDKIVGVNIWRYWPRRPPLRISVKLTARRINKALMKRGFFPDLIISHWPNPNLLISNKLCSYEQRTAINIQVFHDHRYVQQVDLAHASLVGYRNYRIKAALLENGVKEVKTLSFNSSLDDVFLEDFQDILPSERKYDVIVVANFIKRKRVVELLDSPFLSNKKICLIGEGPEETEITQLIELKGLDVVKLPWQTRRDLTDYYRNSKTFMLLSVDEAYGLVYLEAMSQGCYPIGCINEGLEMILNGSSHGLLVPRDINKFPIQLFEELLKSKLPVKELKEKARQHSKQLIAKELINQILSKTESNEFNFLQS